MGKRLDAFLLETFGAEQVAKWDAEAEELRLNPVDERTFAEVTKANDDRFGQTGFIGHWSHNCGYVHFQDGTEKNYSAWDLRKVEKPEGFV